MAKADNSFETDARKHLDNLGYSQFQLVCSPKQTPHGLEAIIDIVDYKITLSYDPNWRGMFERAKELHLSKKRELIAQSSDSIIHRLFGKVTKSLDSAERLKLEEMLKLEESAYGDSSDVLESVVYHEHGHWSICPFDMEHFEVILDKTAKGLRDGGLDEGAAKQNTLDKANNFEDIIVNCVLALDYPNTVKGRSLKFLREAFAGNEKKPALPASYGVFVDVQMRLINQSATFVRDYCKDYDKNCKPVSDEVLMAFGKNHQLGPAAVNGTLSAEEKVRFIEHLKNPESWGDLAYDYARITAHLKPETIEPLNQFILNLMNDPDARAGLIQISLARGHDPGGYMDSFEVFQQKHRNKGSKIRNDIFSSKGANAPAYALPYAFLSARKTDDVFKASFSKIRAKTGGGLQFKEKENPLILPPAAKSLNGSLADLLLVCDNSGSMAGGPYELLVDTIYAIFEGIKAEGKSHLLKYGLLQFSSVECQSWSGWHDNTEALEREFYKTISSNRFGGDTKMPINLLKSADKQGCALIGISDGMIGNSGETINALLEHIGPLVWFQIGETSDIYTAVKQYAKRNKDRMIVAHRVDDISQLPSSLLQVTHHIYKRGGD